MKYVSHTTEQDGVELVMDRFRMRISSPGEGIMRCTLFEDQFQRDSDIVEPQEHRCPAVSSDGESLRLTTETLELAVDRRTGRFTWSDRRSGKVLLREKGKVMARTDVVTYTTGGEKPVIDRVKTVDGERNFIRNLKPVIDRTAYRAKILFEFKDGEGIYGLGQGEEGVYNYRGQNQFLYQHNMRIPIPFFVSSEGYALLVDCGSLMTFNDDANGSYLYCDTVDQLDYYFIAGENLDEIIGSFRKLTGRAALLPKWSFGFVQSKEAYRTGEELVEVARRYRELGLPLDCVVQDWNTWEPGFWGQKTVDKSRYPDLRKTNDALHALNVHSMVSVWPNMNPGGSDHREFEEAGLLLNDYSTYDAFSEKARELYFEQADRELFQGGFDSWWCDSTEPFSGPDWGGEVLKEPWERFQNVGNEHKTYLDAAKANLFALMHAKGIYENQRKRAPEKRVLNLTRSGYASSQRYGTVLWSGDISATWEVLRKQIREGLNFSLSGMPWWTLDIGAFFTVREAWQNRGCGCSGNPNPLWFWQGDYEEGVKDPAYRELYVRWFQYGAFLSMFRSHGTDTPREIWNFGEPGDRFYDAIAAFMKLRYRLMPYIYSLAGMVNRDHSTMVRSLLFDFPGDRRALTLGDEYMFGPAFLVCPVTFPMYYERGGKEIAGGEKTRPVYLPGEGVSWIDFWTGEVLSGGRDITAEAPLERMPLYVRAGSLVPMAEGLTHADETPAGPLEIRVYPGADGSFSLYEDEGEGYGYEKGDFSRIPLSWDDRARTLTLGRREGSYPGMAGERQFLIRIGERKTLAVYSGERVSVQL